MALQENGKLTLDEKKGWTIQTDEGIISLAEEIKKTVQAEARKIKKSQASVNMKIVAELEKHKDKNVELELGDNGNFRIKPLELQPT